MVRTLTSRQGISVSKLKGPVERDAYAMVPLEVLLTL